MDVAFKSTEWFMKEILYLILITSSLSTFAQLKDWEPQNKLSFVYLTWAKENTSNHITINYHSTLDYYNSQVFYSTESKGGDITKYENKTNGGAHRIDSLRRAIHSVTIDNLKPNIVYYFVVGDFKTGYSQEYKFKTLPDDESQIRFITGGDMGSRALVGDMMILAAERDPDFVAIGGDIAYADGKIEKFDRWHEWLSMYTETMKTSDGRLIPMALALGNHEVNFAAVKVSSKAPFFFGLFEQGLRDTTYFKKYFGSHSIMYFLDSGFIKPAWGSQKKWLKKNMNNNKDIINQFAIYHIPLYPSHRSYDGLPSKWARSNWLKYFDRYKLDLAFENHDHTFKVTHPLKNGRIDPEGTIYLGDGCWGKSPRRAHPNRWYLETASESVHVWEVTASKQGFSYEAITEGHQSLYSRSKVNEL